MNMHQQNKVINKSNQKENKEKFIRYNWKIKAKQCRVIEENKQPIIMETKAAIEYAQEKDLDLVEVGYDYKTGISTAKICDYGKYIYELKRKEKLAKKQYQNMLYHMNMNMLKNYLKLKLVK